MRDERGETIDYFQSQLEAAQARLDGLWQLAQTKEGLERATHDKELRVANDRLRLWRAELSALETDERDYVDTKLSLQHVYAELTAILDAVEERLSAANAQAPPDAQPHAFSVRRAANRARVREH